MGPQTVITSCYSKTSPEIVYNSPYCCWQTQFGEKWSNASKYWHYEDQSRIDPINMMVPILQSDGLLGDMEFWALWLGPSHSFEQILVRIQQIGNVIQGPERRGHNQRVYQKIKKKCQLSFTKFHPYILHDYNFKCLFPRSHEHVKCCVVFPSHPWILRIVESLGWKDVVTDFTQPLLLPKPWEQLPRQTVSLWSIKFFQIISRTSYSSRYVVSLAKEPS